MDKQEQSNKDNCEQFFGFCEQFVAFTDAEKLSIMNELVHTQVAKGSCLVDLGQVSDGMYFVKQGCIRLYYLTQVGADITGFIFTENMFVGAIESFLSQQPSTQILETLENCELIVIHYDALQKLYHDVPKFNILIRKVLEMRMIHAQKIVAALITHKPEQRYTEYKNLHPTLEKRIPQHIFSSFMGITPVSLSRIRHRKPK